MKSPNVDTRGTEAAQRAVAEAQQVANNLQRNFATDLNNENITSVVSAGSADAQGVPTTAKKRKSAGAGLSSQLGINV